MAFHKLPGRTKGKKQGEDPPGEFYENGPFKVCIYTTSLQEIRHIGNFTSWQDDVAYQQAFTTLLRHLKVTAPPTL